MYLTYAEYQTMGGELSESEYNKLEFKARKVVDNRTMDRLTQCTPFTALQMLMFELVNAIQTHEETNNISSQSNDGVSVSYTNTSNDDYKEQLNELVELYLDDIVDEYGTPVLFLGVTSWGTVQEAQSKFYVVLDADFTDGDEQ